MKKYVCIQAKHHEEIRDITEKHIESGWRVHTYFPVGSPTDGVNHYILFEKDQ